METKDTSVTCPCCESRLEIDVRTGAILRWRRKAEVDETGKPKVREEDWTGAAERVQQRTSSAAEKFDAGLTREKERERDLDDLFQKASEKLKRKGSQD